ncbi:hypothetical protein PPL_09112 [Heterostelium album PN500]|uniref:Uncharacterized protein n=1 Tax=Heterostelium pallidum (strain ATCC 26659 / Pp 5 / PN500) TaxID=670386 RepID=D3BKN0_HETP5|nr:hypothetical protein PPL_09112 [Heterostelium album PN500]EFA78460.1 hypothetical protein PPL_09112 [Heterostelium album PN500]|eukprot:XP_020430584.1 hypothetical protein PPL_09112 [Heterostelium album PN500]
MIDFKGGLKSHHKSNQILINSEMFPATATCGIKQNTTAHYCYCWEVVATNLH